MKLKELITKVEELKSTKEELLKAICSIRNEDEKAILKIGTMEDYISNLEKDKRKSIQILKDELILIIRSYQDLINIEITKDEIKYNLNKKYGYHDTDERTPRDMFPGFTIQE
jgi:seryl-tRNA synthetase